MTILNGESRGNEASIISSVNHNEEGDKSLTKEESKTMKKNWFEVSREGLKELQAGKPKDFVVRELVQNAWDEETTNCYLRITRLGNGVTEITVEDDSPEGFRDITHAFTLFAPTYKRSDPEKRGRFNIGEKQVLAICDEAVVSTTKGTIVFSSEGREQKPLKRKAGSTIQVKLRMNKEEYEQMLNSTLLYLPPKGVNFQVNDRRILYREPYKVLDALLLTDIQKEQRVIRDYRKTKVHLHKVEDGIAYLYELGLPVCKIDCPYHVDVQQKVPMSVDRNKISRGYLQKLLTYVLNEVYDDVDSSSTSELWIREALSSKIIKEDAVRSIIKKRYGSKVVVATPGDRRSVDAALSHGYRVLYGNELSSPEWENIRKANAIKSASTMFPSDPTDNAVAVERDENMVKVKELVKRIARRCLGVDVKVSFMSWDSKVYAQYGHRTITFNVKQLGRQFFNPPLSARIIDLVVHELAHEKGYHTETSYQDCITRMAGELVMVALKEPEFFKR